MKNTTLSTRLHDDDLDVEQAVPAYSIFEVRDPQPSGDQTRQKQSMWKRTGDSKWDVQNNDAQTNRAGKWKSQP